MPKLLEPLFVADAEALFFVDDEQAEIVEDYVLRQKAMRADEHVDLSGGEIFENSFHFFGRANPADQFHTYREGREAPAEGFVVLEGEDSRGREDRHLLAIAESLESGAHG